MLKKAVITGGAGFIGSNLARALVAEGTEVVVIDNFVAGRKESRLLPEVNYKEVDICDLASVSEIFKGVDVVFHLAALPRVQDTIDHPIDTARTNVDGTLIVLEAARQAGVSKVVFSSSAAIYGDAVDMPVREDAKAQPKNPYGLHKYIGEEQCILWSYLYGLPTISLRYFNVYGPGFDPEGAYASVVGRFIDLRQHGQPLTIAGDGSHTRDYVHVNDVVRANIMAATNSNIGKGEVFNIGSGQETSIANLAELIGGPIEQVAERHEVARSVADISKAREVLGWQPSVELKFGIDELKRLHGLS